MFEAVELGTRVSKKEFDREEMRLRAALLKAQQELQRKRIPFLIIISGVDGAGKPAVVHRLNEWLDPRGLSTHTFWETYEEERERPSFWRFWRVLPGRDKGAIFFGSWYTETILERGYGHLSKSALDSRLHRISFFEQMLVQDGMLIVKFWYHISRNEQYRRLLRAEHDPLFKTRVQALDWRKHKLYNRLKKISERALRETDSKAAPWRVIEATDANHRDLTTARLLLEAMQGALEARVVPKEKTPKPSAKKKSTPSLLTKVNLNEKLGEARYKSLLHRYQQDLSRLSWRASEKKVSTIVVVEGWDGAGKGSSIRRVTNAMDPRLYQVIPIAAPTDEEKAHHYLWRFWRHLPRRGRITIFDRSWYGRVLVERVERFATVEEWQRAYLEINEFEEELSEFGIIICKFWVHISKDEQARRFKERAETPHKQHKITREDWRNRRQWGAYEQAVEEMITRTSTEFAPWHLVPGNDKRTARLHVLQKICAALERRV